MRTTTTALLLMLISPALSWAVLIYNVEQVDLGGGYMVAGGTITTDMPPTTIQAFSIEVTGPVPYTFSSSSLDPATFSNTHLFDFSTSAITIDMDGISSVGPSVENMDNTLPGCSNCNQSLQWFRDAEAIGYSHRDLVDSAPFVRNFRFGFGGVTTVATAVPEPSSYLFMCVVGVAMGAVSFFRKRYAQLSQV